MDVQTKAKPTAASEAMYLQPDDKPPSSAETTSLPYAVLDDKVTYGDFRDDLVRDGFAVVPGVISQEKAASCVDSCHEWLESFKLGYKRDDPSTWVVENLPFAMKGGLFSAYGVAHEQFVWELRQEPGIIDAFAKIWGTNELLVSYDGINVSVPGIKPGEDWMTRWEPWPHIDQSPNRTWRHCVQGLVNFLPNDTNDGGLMVLKGSTRLFAEMFEAFKGDTPEGGWLWRDQHLFSEAQVKWFLDKGCTWHKVNAKPGDLVLWDSRTCHYGDFPKSDNFRIAAYVCYKPAALSIPGFTALKKKAFEEYSQTTHDPIIFAVKERAPQSFNGLPDRAWENKKAPAKPPVLSAVGRKLAGIEAY